MTARPDERIAVVGLGYVGLPLAVAFATAGYPVTGFDQDRDRVDALCRHHDWTGELCERTLRRSGLRPTARAGDLAGASVFVVAVPTPVDRNNCPDLALLRLACRSVGRHLGHGALVVIESTVYPGTTEDICAPELERASGLTCGRDFQLGYSPERINPGDREHDLSSVVKIVAGQDAAALDRIAAVYAPIIPAGLHRAPSIAVAEAAKVIENTQRDLNVALMNEMAIICHRIGIRTHDVLAAAATKWNFVRFHPGLVGGHCVGVDPYYLTARAQQLGYHPEVILAGRRVNTRMGAFVAHEVVRLLAVAGVSLPRARIGVMGLTFKEDVPDLRNSAVGDILATLRGYGAVLLAHDPVAAPAEVERVFGLAPAASGDLVDLDALVLAVPHRAYAAWDAAAIAAALKPGGVFADVRSRFAPDALPPTVRYWSL